MTTICKKFLFSLISIIIIMFLILIFINSNFIEKYYIYNKNQEMIKISNTLLNNLSEENIQYIEENEKIIIAKLPKEDDINALNANIKAKFLEKGLAIDTELLSEDYNAIKSGFITKIYRQDKLNYSLLVTYLSVDNIFLAIATILPNISEVIYFTNIVSLFIFLLIIVFISVTILYLAKKITSSILKICNNTKNIANQKFEKLEINTNDEIELLANDINFMNDEIQKYQNSLIEKNKDIENLLNALTHDLKTPIALIKLYCEGIRDGLDDGTFLNTVIRQNSKLNDIIHQLLDLFKIKQAKLEKEEINITEILNNIINEQEINLKEYSLDLNIKKSVKIYASKFEIEILFQNLVTNAIKYSADKTIQINLSKNEFYITNGINKNIDLKSLFKKFYVGEKSRNKAMSGTGLGLSIIKNICEKNEYKYGYSAEKDRLKFFINFN